jgi:hypothetical protein
MVRVDFNPVPPLLVTIALFVAAVQAGHPAAEVLKHPGLMWEQLRHFVVWLRTRPRATGP